MRTPILLALLLGALANTPARAALHGHPPPPAPGGGNNPTPQTPAPNPGSPSAPGSGNGSPSPNSPTPTGPNSTPTGPGPRSGGGGGGGNGPQTGGDARWLDPTWDLWWHFHREEFLDLKQRVHGGLVTDSLERDSALVPQAATSYRPSPEQLARQAVPLLAEVLGKEHNTELITSALLAAARVGEISVGDAVRLGPLCARLLADPNQEIAEIAALALGILGAEENQPLLESLLHDDAKGREATGSRAVAMRTRSFAAYGLGLLAQHVHSNRARQVIARALTDELARSDSAGTDTRVACVVALALVPLEVEPRSSASAPWVSRQTELQFLMQLSADPATRPILQAHIANTLSELAADSTPEAKELVCEHLSALLRKDSTEAALRESCLMGLGRLADDDQDAEDKRARAELRRTLAGGSTSEHAFALMSLSECAARTGAGSEPGSALRECREVLLDELARGKSRARSWSALALGVLEFRLQHRGAPPAVAVQEALRRALAGAAGPDESGACALALGLCGDTQGAAALVERVLHPGDDVLRGYYALGIGLAGDRTLAQSLRTVSTEARYRPFLLQQCSIALALLGDKDQAPELTRELRTATGQASQSWLAQALGMIGDSRTLPALVEMVRDPRLTDVARGNLTSALGIVCDKDPLPWYHAITSRVNWRAATSTLIAGNGTGILEIL